jgi:ABC-type transport system involved in cytochrome bd biosynthesis fused ATPase/permease subunit
LHHTTELRALGAVEYGANEIAAISDSEHLIAMRAIRVALESSLVTEFLSGVSIGLVAMVVGFALLGGRVTLQHALIAVLVTSEIFAHVRRYGVEFHRREDSERSLALLAVTTSPIAPSEVQRLSATDVVTAASPAPVTFVLASGQSLLVTGPSGSGKTTLLETLLGWREPRSGSVERTGARTGHVSVESSLLSGSLRDNLTLGSALPDAEVLECLSSLGLRGPRFEDLDTALLADGKGISAGEKVRVVLARALLAQPDLLVIDDVAGVLDDEARRFVRRVLDEQRALCIVEATVDTPLFNDVTTRIELRA